MTDEQMKDAGAAWQQASAVYGETLKAMQARLMEAAGAMAALAANAAAAASARAQRPGGGAPGAAESAEGEGPIEDGHAEAYAADLLSVRMDALAERVERIEQVLMGLMEQQARAGKVKGKKRGGRARGPGNAD